MFTGAVWLTPISDPDIYWHIEAGRWIAAHGDVPRVDIFSHTVAGQPWVDMEWLSQVVLWATFEIGGWRGLCTLNGIVAVVVWALLCWRLRRYSRFAIIPATLAIWFASYHFVMRPHMLAMPFLVLWTAEMAAAEEDDRFPAFWTIPMLLVWIQMHGGSIMSIPIAIGFRQWRWAWWATAVGMVTPFGYGYYQQVWDWYQMGDVFRAFIQELRPINSYSDRARVDFVLALVGMALWCGVRLRFNRAAMLVLLTIVCLQHLRGLAVLGMVVPFIVADGVREAWNSRNVSWTKLRQSRIADAGCGRAPCQEPDMASLTWEERLSMCIASCMRWLAASFPKGCR